MKKLFVVVFILLAVVALANADYCIKSKSHTDAMAMMGQNQPAKDVIHEQWIGGDKFANITGETNMVLDLGKGLAWFISTKNKTYTETTLPLDMAKLMPPQVAAMMGAMKSTATVQATGESKTIGQWPCSGYIVTITMMGMPMKMTVWASEKVPFDLDIYKKKMFASLMKGSMRLDDASVAEMLKVKGYWISTEMTMEMMGSKMHTTSEVFEISKKTPGPEVYAIPAGYTKSQYMSMR
jgi:hypothetical protein